MKKYQLILALLMNVSCADVVLASEEVEIEQCRIVHHSHYCG